MRLKDDDERQQPVQTNAHWDKCDSGRRERRRRQTSRTFDEPRCQDREASLLIVVVCTSGSSDVSSVSPQHACHHAILNKCMHILHTITTDHRPLEGLQLV